MRKLLYFWRYYTLGHEQYYECMDKVNKYNLYSLRFSNILVLFIASIFACFPIFVLNDFRGAGMYFLTAFIALLFVIIANWSIALVNNKKKQFSRTYVRFLIVLYYINIVFFGIYLGTWAAPNAYAVSFMIILVCALFLFLSSPIFNLLLTLCSLALFIIVSIFVKPHEIYIHDICNAVFSAFISVFICWRITMLQLVRVLNANKLEDERNRYLDESTIDELTRLKNRRSFMYTFQRYMGNYRFSDDFLCIAIADIDFFKMYNDFYGHPKGDDCLRSIGKAFNKLNEIMGIYCARVGGEEFALLWFEKDISHVDTVVATFNQLIRELKIPHEKSSVSEYVTLSIGVYIEKCGFSSTKEDLYDLADKALYSAKSSGRNCAIVRGRDIPQYQIKPSFTYELIRE